jgi:PKD repeat protein
MKEREHCIRASVSLVVAACMLAGFVMVLPAPAAALEDDALIMGNVTDGLDPIPNTYIKVMMFTAGGFDVNFTWTDTAGDYELEVPGGFDYMVFAANGSYYMSFVSVSILEGETETVDFELDPIEVPTDVTIKGYVKDDMGNPMSNGHVLGIVNDPMGADTPHYANLTTADAGTGYFEVDVIAGVAGGGVVTMDYEGYMMAENVTDDPLVGGETYWFNITLAPPAYADDSLIHGYVTEAGTGVPLQNALVAIDVWNEWMVDDGYVNFTFSDADGYYEMNVTNGSARLMISKGGYSLAMFDLDIAPGEDVEQDAELIAATCVVKGNVTDLKGGFPLSFVNIIITDGVDAYATATTNASGGYELNCFDGTDLWMFADTEGYSEEWYSLDLAPGEVVWRDFGLWPASSWLEGTVTDMLSGDPVEGAWVYVRSGNFSGDAETDGSGYYGLDVVVGTYDVEVNAMDYMWSSTSVDVPDDSTVVHDVELVPWDLPEDCRVYGWVNDSVSGVGIWGAQVAVQLSGGDYRNETGSEMDGFYEIYIPQLLMDARVTAWQHEAVFDAFDAEAETEIRMDFELSPDMYAPNLTYSQDPVYNISALNPSAIDIEVEDLNLREMTLRLARYWKTVGDLEYYYVLDYARTSFDPFNPSNELPYTDIGDSYFVSESWDGTSSAGWFGNETSEWYLMAYEFMAGEDTLYGLRGYYSNDVLTEIPCTAIFDGDTGEIMFFQLDWGYETEEAGDEAGLFEPVMLSQEYDLMHWDWYPNEDYDERLDPWSAIGLRFNVQSEVPSGDYRTFFSASDFGYMSAWEVTNLTVDNDPPIADAGLDQIAVVNTTVTLDGGMSDDNVGIVNYTWEYEDSESVTVTLYGMEVDNVFDAVFDYLVTLTVEDGAGHQDSDSMWVNVTADEPPVADAGEDMLVDEDAEAVFDGSGSSDDVLVDNYTWTIVELDEMLYGVSPSYTFPEPDEYTVELVVTDSIGQESAPDEVIVTVADITDPVADAGTYGDVSFGATTTLDGSGSSDNVGIVEYVWTFTDSTAVELTGVTVEYEFGSPGVYAVTLTVSDAAGNSDVDTVDITVVDDEDPVADAGSDVTIVAGGSVTFDGGDSTDNVAVVDYVWTFTDDGDDVELTGETADYVFENEGNFVVTLTVTDAAGLSDEDTLLVTVSANEPPVANAGADQTVTSGDIVVFDGSDSDDDVGVVEYTWVFTYDGATRTLSGVSPTFVFEIAGEYDVILTVRDGAGQTDSDTVTITVEEDGDEKSFIESYGLIIGALAAIIVVAAAALMLMRRGGGKKPSSSAGEKTAPTRDDDLPPPPDDLDL